MTKITVELTVEGMSCNHCAQTVQKALEQLDGIERVKVDLKAKRVRFDYDPAAVQLGSIKGAIENQGFAVL